MSRISSNAIRVLADERRRQICSAATRLFAAKGFDRSTIADIAREAGVAEGSIYNYFKNKDDLLVSLPRQIAEPIVESVKAHMQMLATDESISPEEMLTKLVSEMLASFRKNVQVFRIMIFAMPRMKQATRQKYKDQVVLYIGDALESYFRKQVERGVFRQDLNAKIAAKSFVGMFIPFFVFREVFQIADDSDWNYDDLITTGVRVFLYGATSPEQRKAK